MLTCLFQYGKWESKIKFGEYGFKDLEDVKSKMKVLRASWKGVVRIHLGQPHGTPRPNRIPVVLTAML